MRAVWAAAIISVTVLSACAGDKNHDGITDGFQPTKTVVQAPSTPTGSLSGVIDTSANNLSGLAGVTVTATLPVTDEKQQPSSVVTTTTDATGYWALSGLPGNAELPLTIKKDGFAPLRITGYVPGELNGHPVSNGNGFTGRWILTQLNGSVKFRVLNHTGRPAKNARATLVVTPVTFSYSGTAIIPNEASIPVVVDGTADADGMITFGGVPSPEEFQLITLLNTQPQYHVTVSPLDEDADGVPDSGGLDVTYTSDTLYYANATTTLLLPDARVGTLPAFSLLSSNVASLVGRSAPAPNLVKPGVGLSFAFSHALQAPSLSVRLTDESGTKPVAIAPATITNGRVVSVTPMDPFVAGREYNISIHAVSADTGAVLNLVGYFFGGDAASPVDADIVSIAFKDTGNGIGGAPDGQLNPGERLEVTFNQPMGYYGALAFAASPRIVYFTRDLDGSGTTGNSTGEIGYSGFGFEFIEFEPQAEQGTLFSLATSGYTTRFLINYTGPGNTPPGTAIQLGFDRLMDSSTGLQSLWGKPVTTALSKPLTLAAP